MSKGTVLVVGATGLLGGMIARRLLDRGERVVALVREGSDYAPLAEAGAELAFGDLQDPDTLSQALHGVSRVVSTATASNRGGEDTIESVDRQGTASLIDAAAAAGVESFVYVSAWGFEQDSPIPIARAKAENEARLEQSGMQYAILRPAAFMDVWIGFVIGAQLQNGPKVFMVGDGRSPQGFVATDNVADLAVAALDHDEAPNARIPLCAEVSSFRDVVAAIERATGQSIEVESVAQGEPIPGLPPIVPVIWAGLAEFGTPPVTDDVHRTYGVRPITVDAFVQRAFGPGARTPAAH